MRASDTTETRMRYFHNSSVNDYRETKLSVCCKGHRSSVSKSYNAQHAAMHCHYCSVCARLVPLCSKHVHTFLIANYYYYYYYYYYYRCAVDSTGGRIKFG
jgi:hypothetical protein